MNIKRIIDTHLRPWTKTEQLVCLLLTIIVISIIIAFTIKKKLTPLQAFAGVIIFLYLTQVFATTVFTRDYTEQRFALTPFWSWRLAMQGDTGLKEEIILNFLMLIPVGIFLPILFSKRFKLRYGILLGIFISITIETCQFIWKCGLVETDDLIGNTCGCVIGCIATVIYQKIYIKIQSLTKS